MPVSPEDPCGPNLEYDAAFVALERAFEGKPEQQIGSTVVAAQPPNWRDVESQAGALLGRSKDMRAACRLAIALLNTRGFEGFADGLSALRILLEKHWENVHPRLDPDDGRDPTMRVNVLLGLAEPAVLGALRAAPMIASRALGKFTLKDLEIATGDAQPAEGAAATPMATLEAALMECDIAALETTTNAARTAGESAKTIEAFVTEQVGAANAPNLGRLHTLLRKAGDFLGAGLARRQPPPVVEGEGDGAGGAAGHNGVTVVKGLSGEVTSRDDVLRALDKICAYYAKYEPSSPVPIFMERCKKLVSKTFLDIVRDLVPDAVSQVEVFKGRDE